MILNLRAEEGSRIFGPNIDLNLRLTTYFQDLTCSLTHQNISHVQAHKNVGVFWRV